MRAFLLVEHHVHHAQAIDVELRRSRWLKRNNLQFSESGLWAQQRQRNPRKLIISKIAAIRPQRQEQKLWIMRVPGVERVRYYNTTYSERIEMQSAFHIECVVIQSPTAADGNSGAATGWCEVGRRTDCGDFSVISMCLLPVLEGCNTVIVNSKDTNMCNYHNHRMIMEVTAVSRPPILISSYSSHRFHSEAKRSRSMCRRFVFQYIVLYSSTI